MPKYHPEMPHISMNRNSQKPSALCRSQLTRRHPAVTFTPRLRFQRDTPGHQTTAPVSTEAVKIRLSSPFHHGPSGRSRRRSSWRRVTHRTNHCPSVVASPRSAPVYGLKRRSLVSPPRVKTIVAVGSGRRRGRPGPPGPPRPPGPPGPPAPGPPERAR